MSSFEGGVLTISLAGGGHLSARVTDDTEIECEGSEAHSSSSGDDDEQGDDDDQGDDEDEDEDCGTAALTEGATVEEAELHAGSGGAVWEEIELGS